MLHQQQFNKLKAYWLELKAENAGSLPRRRQFNPMRVPKLLPYVFLVERREEGDLYVRLAGTAIEAAIGRSLSGQRYLDLYDESQWRFFSDMTAAMCGHPCGGRIDREVTFHSGKTMEMHSLNLPFASEAGEVRYVLGLVAMRRTAYQHGLGDDAKVKMFTVRDFEFIDLGFGVPADEPVKAWLQKASA